MSKKKIIFGLFITLTVLIFAPLVSVIMYLVGRPSSLPPVELYAVVGGVVLILTIIYFWVMLIIGDRRGREK
ncbi:hypothetical protein KAR91_00720 [Candidatus Pacearchaeota archaeon]|nr:hypothetical protein [Candidatus Pacearchaeota archaeon]